MLKKIIFILFLFIILFVRPVSAHFLEHDGTIGAVLHIDPDDDPIVQESTNFFFEIKDTTNRFKPRDCDCQVSILEKGKSIFSQALFNNNPNPSLENAGFNYTFLQKDVYLVQLTGKPYSYSANSFQPFTLSWSIRVARENSNQRSNAALTFISGHIIHIIGAFGIGILFVVLLIIQHNRKSNSTT